ncbi:MAG: lamin tail domain-containing protein [Acidimicrobiia bacterium]|nr:lamin tail domain-containing protein [Acidimicrobiia bacterium]
MNQPTADTTTPPITASNIDTSLAVPATVATVLDGDSFRATVAGNDEEIRLLGINAPERGECRSEAAADRLEDLVEGDPVLLVPDARDQFDRMLATAYLDDTGLDVGLILVWDGLAIALTVDHPDRFAYFEAERDAFVEGRGIWDRTGCGAGFEDSRVYVDFVESDPPGDDLAGEIVTLGNDGPTPADLSGWVLRDESSANRYSIPSGTVLEPGGILTIWTGCGNDTAADLFWCADQPVWNNGGDAAFLLDPNGNIVSWFRYLGD